MVTAGNQPASLQKRRRHTHHFGTHNVAAGRERAFVNAAQIGHLLAILPPKRRDLIASGHLDRIGEIESGFNPKRHQLRDVAI